MAFLQSIEFWIVLQTGIDLCLIALFLIAIRQFRAFRNENRISSLEDVQKTIQPVLEDAKELADRFEAQLKEKQDIIRRLNFSLDDRIIGLNLLLKRTESRIENKKVGKEHRTHFHKDVDQLQQDIIRLYEKGMSSKNISVNLGIAKGEVDLVLNLKKKFEEIERA